MPRKTLPLVIGRAQKIVGNALVEDDGRITLINFDGPYASIYENEWLTGYAYQVRSSPGPHVAMVGRSTPGSQQFSREEIPAVLEDTLGEAARMLKDKLQWNQESAESAISTLVLNGFVIRKVSRGFSPDPA